MIRFIISFYFIFQALHAVDFTYPDFRQCYNKNVQSFVYFGNIRAVAITPNLAVAYSKTRPKIDYVKFDPFLNLYLFHSKKTLKPAKLRSTRLLKLGEWIAGMDDTSLYVGNFAKSGVLLDSFHLQNGKLEANSIISCLCCEIYGLGVGSGTFIGSEYIKRFISNKNVYYGDIGVSFEKKAKNFVVKSVDPFYPKQSLHVADKILKIDNKKILSLKQLNQTILFSKPNSTINIEFLRGNKKYKKKLIVRSKIGGGYLSDSSLENKGIFFDKNLKIVKIKKNSFAQTSGLLVGDKLMQIDNKTVKNQKDVQVYISKLKSKDIQLLFDRANFQFFVKMKI
ncbi:MAG: PDZ domain-containing protein [Sulfurospirillum sp.]|nr:PDZ domain-containing protein [Sulfurospirillum sp.]MBL0702780.1 PDZ domain-containing protein [Sulfurospirillum sp.]